MELPLPRRSFFARFLLFFPLRFFPFLRDEAEDREELDDPDEELEEDEDEELEASEEVLDESELEE